MPCQIQKNHTNPENHTNPSRTHKSTNPKKSYKPRNQTQKNHKRILYKKKKINPYIYTNQIIQKKKIDLNLKIKSIQSLTKYPQNWTNPAQSLNQTNIKPPIGPNTNPPIPHQNSQRLALPFFSNCIFKNAKFSALETKYSRTFLKPQF